MSFEMGRFTNGADEDRAATIGLETKDGEVDAAAQWLAENDPDLAG